MDLKNSLGKINWLLISALACSVNFSYAATTDAATPDSVNTDINYWKQFSKAKELITQNKVADALPILQKLEKTAQNYNVELELGNAFAILNNPAQALSYFEAALRNSKKNNNEIIERTSLFKIAKMQIWLNKYHEAQQSYQSLLNMPLSPEDKTVATTGLLAVNGEVKKIETREAQLKKIEKIQNTMKVFSQEVTLGDAEAKQEKPLEALKHYQNAYQEGDKSQNIVSKRIALFKIAKTELWLKHYSETTKTYEQLLTFALSNDDKSAVTAGLKELFYVQLGEDLKQAIHFIELKNGVAAFNRIKPYLGTVQSFKLYLVAAQSMGIQDNPQKSLDYFHQAYPLANHKQEKILSLLGILKMQLWLNNTVGAAKTINHLQKLPLSLKDKTQLNLEKQKFKDLIEKIRFENTLAKARKLLNMNAGRDAFQTIEPYLYTQQNFQIYMIAAESMTIQNNPIKALFFYRQAFRVSQQDKDRKMALFGIAKMQFWLAWYVQAGRSYGTLLTYHLSSDEFQLALGGLVKSLAYYDRPQKAFLLIPPTLKFTKPELAIAAAQASSWADWSDITKNILIDCQSINKNVNPFSGIGKDLRDVTWQTRLATWPSVFTPSFYMSQDTDTFTKKRGLLNYKYYWSQLTESFVELDLRKYHQDDYFNLEAKGVNFGQILRPTRHLTLKWQAEPTEFTNETALQRNHWNPMFWSADGSFRPNDYVTAQLLTQKDVIETFPAFADHITTNLYSATLLINPLPYVKLNGSYNKLEMSDSNFRDGTYLSASWLILPDLGLSLTGISREYSNKFRSPDYFSPHHYQEDKVLFRLGRRLGATWHYYIDGGFGRQHITPLPHTPTVSSPTNQYGVGINGPITNCLFVTAFYGRSKQASAFINSPGYAYEYGGVSFNVLL